MACGCWLARDLGRVFHRFSLACPQPFPAGQYLPSGADFVGFFVGLACAAQPSPFALRVRCADEQEREGGARAAEERGAGEIAPRIASCASSIEQLPNLGVALGRGSVFESFLFLATAGLCRCGPSVVGPRSSFIRSQELRLFELFNSK
eukprot:6208762-Pleurochrysis_carterae.AAC.1